jgi:hypothetical protein
VYMAARPKEVLNTDLQREGQIPTTGVALEPRVSPQQEHGATIIPFPGVVLDESNNARREPPQDSLKPDHSTQMAEIYPDVPPWVWGDQLDLVVRANCIHSVTLDSDV